MRRIIIRFLLPLFAAALLASCEKVIDFSGKQQEPLLVLNSIATPDACLQVNLSHSVFFLDGNFDGKNPGIVLSGSRQPLKLYVNGGGAMDFSLVDTLGNYVSSYRPKEGDDIRIEASVDGYEPVNVETVVPRESSFDFTVDSSEKPSFEGYRFAEGSASCTVTVADDASASNFYMLQVIVIEYFTSVNPETGRTDTLYFLSEPEIRSDDVILKQRISSSSLFDESDDGSLRAPAFSDALFNGSARRISFNVTFFASSDPGDFSSVESGKYAGNDAGSGIKYAIQVNLYSLSRDYYYYYLTRNADSSNDSFAEPEQVYSNVKGGIGILGAIVGNPKVVQF